MGPAVTHKREVVRHRPRHQSPVRTARETKHSQASVDRYIGDHQQVRFLAQKVPLEEISAKLACGMCLYPPDQVAQRGRMGGQTTRVRDGTRSG
jgi:hypothetical protein